MARVKGKIALVTGGSRGIGAETARVLAREGATVIVTDILIDKGQALADSIEGKFYVLDVADESAWKKVISTIKDKFGRLDIAINNAGIAHVPAPMHEMTEEIIDLQFAVNVKGVMFGMKYQLPQMLSQKQGHILNVSSLAGLGGAPKGGAYAAAKHAVAGVTRTAAVEYGRKNVRVNAVCPFYSPTNILNVDGYNTKEAQAQLGMGSPMKRLGEPQEIVNAMILMLSPGNSYMNGQTIAVDGGVTAW